MNQNEKKIAGLALMLMLALALVGLLLPGTAAAADPDVAQIIHSNGAVALCETLSGAMSDVNNGDLVILLADVTLNSSLTISKNITLDLNGKTLQRSGNAAPDGYVIYIESGSTLTLVDTISGKKGTVTGGKGELNGGGVRVAGTLNMYGGTITGNTANNGGGVYVNGGTFNMYNGTISDNTSIKKQGTSDTGDGGGVYVNGGTFTMTGGTISGNHAGRNGIGVYVFNGSFTLDGGTISGNESDTNAACGGGVYMDGSNGTFTMIKGTIAGNKLTKNGNGGGVYVNDSTFTMESGTISNNAADKDGGGVYTSLGIFIMRGGTISGNEASNLGGGVYVRDRQSAMYDGEISGNKASLGGGVYVDSASFYISKGTISGNEAFDCGGGVYVDSKAFRMAGGTIISNTAANNGGGVYLVAGTIELFGSPVISSNKAKNAPDNVYLPSGKKITITDALTEGSASVGISMKKPGDFTTGWADKMPGSKPEDFFTGDNSFYYARLNDSTNEACLVNGMMIAEIAVPSQTYTGTALTPEMTVKIGKTALAEDTDYTVAWKQGEDPVKSFINAGEYTAVLTGAGSYSGTRTATFTVNAAPLTVTANTNTITYGDVPEDGGVTYQGLVGGDTESDLSGTLTYTYSYEQFGNVGSYTITPGGLTAQNYTFTFTAGPLTVEPKEVGLEWTAGTFTYNGEEQAPTAAATDLVNKDKVSVTVKGAVNAGDNLTAAAAGLTGKKADNYKLPKDNTFTFSIGKAAATVTAEAGTKVYGEKDPELTAKVTGAVKGDTISYTLSREEGENVGEYAVTVTPGKNPNYDVTVKGNTFTITKAPSSVTKAPKAVKDLVYTGKAQKLITAGNAEGGELQYVLGKDDKTAPAEGWSTDIPKGIDAGTYTVWYYVKGDANHLDTEPDKVSVTIAPKSIANAEVTLSETSLIYTGVEQTVTVESVKLGETALTAGTDYEVTGGITGTDKGTYTVTVTGKGSYKDTAKASWSIGLATPEIAELPAASAVTYGQMLSDSTLTGGKAVLGELTVEGTFAWKNSETKPAVADSEKTEYDVVFTPKDDKNYAPAACKVKLTVNRAASSVTKTPKAVEGLVYSGEARTLITAGTAEGGELRYALGTDEKTAPAEGWSTELPKATEAGDYPVWYKVIGDENHTDTEPSCVSVTIQPAPVMCTVSFSANGGKGSMASVQVDKGQKYTLPECGFTAPKGNEFSKWNKGAPGKEITVNEDTVITARWKLIKLTVTFDANGGAGAMKAVKVKYGTEYKLPKCKFTAPSGKVFDKWDKGTAGKKIKITKDLTIKAKWKNIPVKRSYTFFGKMTSSGNTSLKITWGKVPGADGYEVWLALCGKGTEFSQVHDDAEFRMIRDVKASKGLSYKITGLKKGTCYKVYVKAYKLNGKKKTYIGKRSELVHAIAGGSGKKTTTPASVTVKKPEVTLSLSETKTDTIQATVKGLKPGLQILNHGGKLLRFFSSNLNIAKVSSTGEITAVNAGECTIWVLTNNGIRAQVKVTVTR